MHAYHLIVIRRNVSNPTSKKFSNPQEIRPIQTILQMFEDQGSDGSRVQYYLPKQN